MPDQIDGKQIKTATIPTTALVNGALGSLVYSNISVPAGDTIANTAAETTFTDPSYSIPANSLVAGTVIRIYLWGVYGTATVDVTKTLQIKIKIGGTTYLATGALTTVLSITNDGWSAEAFFTIFSIGSSGTIDAQAYYEFETAATTALNVNVPNTGTQTINTTISQAITVTAQWGTANASNTITLRQIQIYIDNLSTASNAGTFLQVSNALSDVPANAWTVYSSTLSGWSGTPTQTCSYFKIGKLCIVEIIISGTSNATIGTFTLPFASLNSCGYFGKGKNNSVDGNSAIITRAASATVDSYQSNALLAWTATGTKEIRITITYQTT